MSNYLSSISVLKSAYHPSKPLLKSSLTIAALLLLAMPIGALATVSGGQRIDVLGYEVSDNKVYILRHFDDARGRLPQLYYYDLNIQPPQKLVEVRSLYINPKTKKFDEIDDKDAFFNQRLNRIKQRVTKLEPEYISTSIKVNSLTQRQTQLESWLGPIGEGSDETFTEYQFSYKVSTADGKYASASQEATAYKVCLLDSGVIYHIPNKPYAITTVKYIGTLMEGGYEYEDAVLLKKQ